MNVRQSLRGSVKKGSHMKEKFLVWSLCVGTYSYMNCLQNYNHMGVFLLCNNVTRICVPLCFTVLPLTSVSQPEKIYIYVCIYILGGDNILNSIYSELYTSILST
jgi:hypothetical protein